MPRLDHERIALMARSGLRPQLIAERLGCSERQVRRILYAGKVLCRPSELAGTDEEWRLWELYRSMGESISRIALRFGLSRQTLQSYFSQVRVVSGGELA